MLFPDDRAFVENGVADDGAFVGGEGDVNLAALSLDGCGEDEVNASRPSLTNTTTKFT